jgi:hypothetical protein
MSRRRDQKKREQSRRRIPAPHTTGKPDAPSGMSRTRVRELSDSVCAEARLTATRFLTGPDRTEQVIPLAGATRDFALRVIQKSPDAGRHECRAGCAFCCHTAVTVAPPEAFAILQHLRANCSADELAEVRRRIESNAGSASRLTRRDYVAGNIRCALLTDDGQCRVHPVRPLACAGFLSTSRSACEAEFNRVPGRGEVPIDRYAMLAGLSASYGLKEACQRAGVDGEYYELHHALRRLWDAPGAQQTWAAGGSLFEGCVRADSW